MNEAHSEPTRDVPTVEQYVRALSDIETVTAVTVGERRILQFHYNAPERTITARQLATELGYEWHSPANAQYGRLGRMMGDHLGFRPRSEKLSSLVLFDKRHGEWHWIMRPQLAAALEVLAWTSPNARLSATEPRASFPPSVRTATSGAGTQAGAEQLGTSPGSGNELAVLSRQWSLELSADDYVAGLKAIEPEVSALQKRLLVQQYHAPSRSVSSTELARLADVPGGHSAVNALYGRLGHMFVEATAHQPDRRTNGEPRWWVVWSRGRRTSNGFIWEMLPAVAEALERLEWVRPGVPSPELLDHGHAQDRLGMPFASPRWRVGTAELRSEGTQARAGSAASESAQVHNQLQNALFRRLITRFGEQAVVMEEGFADIKVRLPNGSVDLFEVKSDNCPQTAIRAALGQLLEYSYAASTRGQHVRFVVVAAPSPPSASDQQYLAYLDGVVRMDLRYLQIHESVAVDSYQIPR